MPRYRQGMFKPLNPKKYRGNPRAIAYRSGWEFSCMVRMDTDPAVLWWQSEEVIVPYTNPVNGAFARYFPDIVYAVRGPDGAERVMMVEIKPYAQTQPPRAAKRGARRSRVIAEALAYSKNLAKWQAASRFCEKRGWEFKILTERDVEVWK